MTEPRLRPWRVAFTIFGGHGWTGGINYLDNLLSALVEDSTLGVQPVLFCGEDADPAVVRRLESTVGSTAVRTPLLDVRRAASIGRHVRSYLLQRDFAIERLFRQEKVDVVFQHGIWLGRAFRLPTIAWIADFQHHHLPAMFPSWKRVYRTLDYRLLSTAATRVMVSSEDARRDCERFYPSARGKVDVLPFVVRRFDAGVVPSRNDLDGRYALPARYLYMPNQFWRHKNHLVVVDALECCRRLGVDPVVVATGNLVDNNNPLHPKSVLDRVRDLGLGSSFRYIGHVPYLDVVGLMTHAAALVNPSLFEGWSTTVEEAKAIGIPLLLSDLDVHREQAPDTGRFFDPHDPEDVARVLADTWIRVAPPADPATAAAHAEAHEQRRRRFAIRFRDIVRSCAGAR